MAVAASTLFVMITIVIITIILIPKAITRINACDGLGHFEHGVSISYHIHMSLANNIIDYFLTLISIGSNTLSLSTVSSSMSRVNDFIVLISHRLSAEVIRKERLMYQYR